MPARTPKLPPSLDMQSSVARATSVFVSRRGRPTANQAEIISRQILNTATAAFLANGYEATSMEEIARTAGLPKSTLYKRFADKQALLRAVIEARVATWSLVASRKNWMLTEDLAQRLKQYACWMLVWATSPEVCAFRALAARASSATGDVERRLDVVGFGKMLDLIEQDIVALGPKDGVHAKDPRGAAVAIMAILAGWLELRTSGEQVGEKEAATFARTAIDLLLRGSAAW